jgi:hypothetical protein
MSAMIKYFFFPIFKTKSRRWYHYVNDSLETLVSIAFIGWALYYFYGYRLFFQERLSMGNIVILSDQKRDTLSVQQQRRIKQRLQAHHIDMGQLEAKIFLIRQRQLYMLFMFPPGIQLIADRSAGFTFADRIHLMYASKKDHEAIVDSIAHELVHVWQNRRYTPWWYMHFKIPEWVAEGYAVYASGEDRLADKKMDEKAFLQRYSGEVNRYYRDTNAYTLWGLMVKHAIEKMHKSVDDLHLGKVSYDEVFASLMDEYNVAKVTK